ncbi:hypothetical protein DZA65_02959 [Dickeya dianthicola]|nr:MULTISPECIES: hypothetical protein [Dickeya]AYC19837.1 hypothetical protein DZA65_02959 [Dickeya dianthicola]MBI0436427.1 hypothetical protein [Dickeya dianthicola]MBI0447389.1 hypothetical protein [Dickeya dianthicola]MBI0451764.1 hypothetical protein [Dickeya dianthicola]MBI0456175.1 hypothetical protein [Dickeya dianthicola]
MKFKTIALVIALSATSFGVAAVDGYKGVKFGSDLKTVIAAKWCNLKKYEEKKINGVESYYCQDFKFSGSNSLAMVLFLNGKFERLAITLNDGINPVVAALERKYGQPSSSSTPEEAKAALANGGSIYIKYDNDTIFVAGHRDASTGKDFSQLIYTSPNFDQAMEAQQAKNLGNDL